MDLENFTKDLFFSLQILKLSTALGEFRCLGTTIAKFYFSFQDRHKKTWKLHSLVLEQTMDRPIQQVWLLNHGGRK